MEYKIQMLKDEQWWGGIVSYFNYMPFTAATTLSIDLLHSETEAMINPLFVSDKGRCFYSEDGFTVSFDKGEIRISSKQSVTFYEDGKSLKDAYLEAYRSYFEKDDRVLPNQMFTAPQYCTWMKFRRNQNQKGILAYAQDLLDKGLPAGELIIDEGWHENYCWRFHAGRFEDPKAMVEKLHDMGFKVVLWTLPFVDSAGEFYLNAREKGILVKKAGTNDPAIIRWWAGFSPALDLTNPEAVKFWTDILDGLVETYKVDGFKFDGGNYMFYERGGNYTAEEMPYEKNAPYVCSFFKGNEPIDQQKVYPELAKRYPICEVRHVFGHGYQKVNFRAPDRKHTWDMHGLPSIIPYQLAMGLLGYAFCTPDMVGGGSEGDVMTNGELFVRWCQASAFAPLIQLSYDFWNYIDEDLANICLAYVELRSKMPKLFVALKEEYEQTGLPMMRTICFETGEFPECLDKYMFGKDLLIAPIQTENTTELTITLPKGTWLYYGRKIEGGKEVTLPAPLSVLPIFEREGANIGVHEIIVGTLKKRGVTLLL